jgi:transposase-like protein
VAREYSPEVKAAVMAALLSGQSASSAAKEYGIPRGTVAAWRTRDAEPFVALVATDAAQKKQEEARAEIKALVLELLIAQLKSQIAMANHAADKEWLHKQFADGLAVLYGVGNDKVFRMLEALGSVGTEPGTTRN